MTRRWMLGAALALMMGVPAQAAGTVALLPATVGRGAPENAKVVTQALRSTLEEKGFRLVADAKLSAAMRAARVNPRAPIPIATLAQIRKATGADYVIYPRVLSVGMGINSTQYQATIIVNVTGASAKSFAHTRQVGQAFDSREKDAGRAVIGTAAAEEAAGKLLEGFFAKAR